MAAGEDDDSRAERVDGAGELLGARVLAQPAEDVRLGQFGVTTVARGTSCVRSASWASSSSRRAPLSEIITGSRTIGTSPTRSSASPTASVAATLPSMPIFTASTPMSSTTARTCATITSPGTGCTAVTPTVF